MGRPTKAEKEAKESLLKILREQLSSVNKRLKINANQINILVERQQIEKKLFTKINQLIGTLDKKKVKKDANPSGNKV